MRYFFHFILHVDNGSGPSFADILRPSKLPIRVKIFLQDMYNSRHVNEWFKCSLQFFVISTWIWQDVHFKHILCYSMVHRLWKIWNQKLRILQLKAIRIWVAESWDYHSSWELKVMSNFWASKATVRRLGKQNISTFSAQYYYR